MMDLLLSQFYCNDNYDGASHNRSTCMSLHYFCCLSCKRPDVGFINLKRVSETYAIVKKKKKKTEKDNKAKKNTGGWAKKKRGR
jgi:hypothetical protein